VNFLIIALFLPVVGSFLIFALRNWSHRARGFFASGISLASFLLVLTQAGPLLHGKPMTASFEWFPKLGIAIAFYGDALSFMFALLISGIGFLICIYAIGYLHDDRIDTMFWFSLLLFMGSMLGLVFSGDFIILLIFWEMTSISSFLLIGINYWDEEARRGALNALFVTASGGLCLLAGFLLVAAEIGSFSIPYLLANGVPTGPVMTSAMLLILLGAFTKSAHFPFHFWLPQAMAAPTPISAYLHSATMVKAGIYLIIRLFPVFGPNPYWNPIIMGAGLLTFMVGGILAIGQEDAKALLAYSTISQLGMITFMLGIGTEAAMMGALFHILAHATFKGALFMGAGAIDHTLGTRRLDQIGPLTKSMPLVGWTMALCGWSMAGMIPFSGFVSKEAMFKGIHKLHAFDTTWILIGAIVASVFTFLYSFRFVIELPFGSARSERTAGPEHSPHGLDKIFLTWPPAVLGVGTILLGVGLFRGFGSLQGVINHFVHQVGATVIHHPSFHFQLWHGISFPLKMTGIVVGSGLLLYALLPYMLSFWSGVSRIPGPETVNRIFQDNLVDVAHRCMSVVIRGPLPKYLRVMLGFLIAVTFLAWFNTTTDPFAVQFLPTGNVSYTWIPFILVVLVSLGMLLFRKPVPAVIALGMVGFLVSLIYLVFHAPDLILTQISVETVSIVIFLWVLKDIDFISTDRTLPRGTDLLIAGLSAFGMVYVLLQNQALKSGYTAPAKYYFEYSLPEAWGKNMVNVILVDFRALDTLGEISVLAIATLGILAMLRVTFDDRTETEEVAE
jgi:multicomponent K+:H+ antiporter subunit A